VTFRRRGEPEPQDGGFSELNSINSPFIDGSKGRNTTGSKRVWSNDQTQPQPESKADKLKQAQAQAQETMLRLADLFHEAQEKGTIEAGTAYDELLVECMNDPALVFFMLQIGVIAVDTLKHDGKDNNTNG